MTDFKTQVDLDVMLDRKDNYDIETKKINLRWNLELEMRQYGVKDFIITVPDQTVTIDLNVWGEDTDTQEQVTLEIKDVLVERASQSSQLIPNSLEFYKGKWTLIF